MTQISPIAMADHDSLSPPDDGITLPWDELAGTDEIAGLLALVRHHFGAAAASISILGRQYQWILATDGLSATVMPLRDSVCRSVLYERALNSVGDLSLDPLLAAHPYVAAPGGLRSYAGVRLRLENALTDEADDGALCIVDTVPRQFDADDIARLEQFAGLAKALVTARIAQGRAARMFEAHCRLVEESARKDRLFRQTERMIDMGSWRMDLATQAIDWSPGVYAIHALTPSAAPELDQATAFYDPADRPRLLAAMTACAASGTPFDLELDFTAADGRRKRVRAVGEREHCDGRPVALIGMFQDISVRYRLERGLRDQAFTDPLTGIANRAALQAHLADLFACAPAPGAVAAVLIDLDGFKAVNDRLGHARGDEILRTAAMLLRDAIGDGALVARYGGDEFVIVVTGTDAEGCAAAHVETAMRTLAITVPHDGGTIPVGASAGVAVNRQGDTPIDLLRRADDAMYRRKHRGGKATG